MTPAQRLWRSPALRFLALGAALFGLESIVHARHHPNALTLRRDTVQTLRGELRAELGRDPTRAELTARVERYADDERLSRTAITQRVWEGDPVLRQRLIERAAWTLCGEVTASAPTPDELARPLRRALPEGAWSPPLETRDGWPRVRVTARLPPGTLTVAQAGARLVADGRDGARARGHAPTLALAALATVPVSVAWVEALIAGSVWLLAANALLAGAFGLVHGLGFAEGLHAAGLRPGERVLALASINAGIELAQLAVVLAAALLGLAVARWRPTARAWATRALVGGADVAGGFWLTARVVARVTA